jgi:hypothetical protein
LRLEPLVDLLSDLILGEPAALLDFAFELFTPAVDHSQVIGGELAPFGLDLSFELLPVSLNPVPIR